MDSKLSSRRHYPSINWLQSYSLYKDTLGPWYTKKMGKEWNESNKEAMKILQEEEKLQELVQLVGSDALPEKEQITLEVARLLREFFLQQNAFHKTDAYCSLEKTKDILQTILWIGEKSYDTLEKGVRARDIVALESKNKISEAKFEEDYQTVLKNVKKIVEADLKKLIENI